MKKIQIFITLGALFLVLMHIILPDIKIDAITVVLVIISIIPWVGPLFRSVELPGGLKFEFQELERVKMEAKEAGLINGHPIKNKSKYDFVEIAKLYPHLALASLRIELEKSLKNLAVKTKVACTDCINKKAHGISHLTRDLFDKGIISLKERAVLEDMIGTLNRAVHGEEVDKRVTEWVIDIGPQILESINGKIDNFEVS